MKYYIMSVDYVVFANNIQQKIEKKDFLFGYKKKQTRKIKFAQGLYPLIHMEGRGFFFQLIIP